MGFSRPQRNTIWQKYHGNKVVATDCFGRLMNRFDFEADHIYPESKGGLTVIENGQPLASLSNQEKADNFQGEINGRKFKVEPAWTNIGRMRVDNKLVTL